jgi:hypothetical protein
VDRIFETGHGHSSVAVGQRKSLAAEVVILGLSVFNVKNGKVVGFDFAIGRYHGPAIEDAASREITLDLTFEVPAGADPVQRTAYTRRIKQTLPPDFGDGAPIKVDTRRGILTAMVKRIPDDYEQAAFYGFILRILG